ncbi:preprotein translocase subunit SecY [Bacillus sp. RG28]|uniref:Protein translocase subunit SecY n=1 Tax=Gottfriedia endophytica TaxID=2820819 RepID=A0A940NUM7_9BACI|nr:preprotein translocase subunit SecY [Gottfriedia endophytica]MBP0727076.1 preprotein translocase subunit SecY [Gottfriedia endophytica]
MFRTISNFMRVADIRRKIFFTLLMLIVFRIGTFIPVPNVNADVLASQDSSLGAFGVLNTFGGGALKKFSIFAMGIMPYITASIVIQLLQMDVVPKLTEWSKQGEIGRRKLNQLTRYVTIGLGFIEAIGLSVSMNNATGGVLITSPGWSTYLYIATVLTAGTAFLLWLGEQITAKGVGNGISIIIFAGIIAAIPTTINQVYLQQFKDAGDALFLNSVKVGLVVLVLIVVIVAVIFIQQANRKIPIQYAKRNSGNSYVGGESTHLPLKVNSAGVIPVIFAVSFLVTPSTIASFFPQNDVTAWIKEVFNYSNPWGMAIYLTLIIAFSYFYTFVQVNPEQMAENLQKQGGYIPGIRPGKSTQEYITKVLYRLTFVGSIFLAVIALLPIIFGKVANLPPTAQIGGTSLLIVVGVALETMKQLESQLVKRHYKGFIK